VTCIQIAISHDDFFLATFHNAHAQKTPLASPRGTWGKLPQLSPKWLDPESIAKSISNFACRGPRTLLNDFCNIVFFGQLTSVYKMRRRGKFCSLLGYLRMKKLSALGGLRPTRVVRWLDHLGAMCSRAWRALCAVGSRFNSSRGTGKARPPT